jgi:TonB family protein
MFFLGAATAYAATILIVAIAAVMMFNPGLAEAINLKVPLVPTPVTVALTQTQRTFSDSRAFRAPSATVEQQQPGPVQSVRPDLPVINGVGDLRPMSVGSGGSDTRTGLPPGNGVPGSGRDLGAPPPPSSTEKAPTPSPERKPSISPVSEGVLRGSAIARDIPLYPEIAKRSRVQGMVQVLITIGEDGTVLEASVLNGHPVLRQAALDSARRWRFSPTLLSRVPVKVQGVLTFNFRLD